MSELLELAERCEAAKEADTSWLMKDVGAVAYGHGSDAQKCRRFYRLIREGAYLDAAMTLVPEGCIVAITNVGVEDAREPDFTKATAIVGRASETANEPVVAVTPALALCAAVLRSHHMSREG